MRITPAFSLPTIVRLLLVSGPTTVGLAVIAIVIFSIQCHPDWSLSHVRKEVLKRMQPSGTYLDSPSAVRRPVLATRVAASVFHSVPRFVSSAVRHSVLETVPVGFGEFFTQASATSCVSSAESVCFNRMGVAAVALAKSPIASFLPENPYDFQSIKHHADECNLFFHTGMVGRETK